jgi:preprotein translocase subunit SecE
MDGEGVFEQIARFAREVRAEMRKVVWPDRRQTTVFTVVVLVSTAFIGLLIWGFDSLLNLLLGLIIHVNA